MIYVILRQQQLRATDSWTTDIDRAIGFWNRSDARRYRDAHAQDGILARYDAEESDPRYRLVPDIGQDAKLFSAHQ